MYTILSLAQVAKPVMNANVGCRGTWFAIGQCRECSFPTPHSVGGQAALMVVIKMQSSS